MHEISTLKFIIQRATLRYFITWRMCMHRMCIQKLSQQINSNGIFLMFNIYTQAHVHVENAPEPIFSVPFLCAFDFVCIEQQKVGVLGNLLLQLFVCELLLHFTWLSNSVFVPLHKNNSAIYVQYIYIIETYYSKSYLLSEFQLY